MSALVYTDHTVTANVCENIGSAGLLLQLMALGEQTAGRRLGLLEAVATELHEDVVDERLRYFRLGDLRLADVQHLQFHWGK